MKRFEIKTGIDMMIAKRLLSDHKAELETQRTEKAIIWQIGIIKELKNAIKNSIL